MYQGHLNCVWEKYEQTLALLQQVKQASEKIPYYLEKQKATDLIFSLYCRIGGMERLLDCFEPADRINAVRRKYGLPDLPLPRPWDQPDPFIEWLLKGGYY